MKKFITVLFVFALAFVLTLSLAACGRTQEAESMTESTTEAAPTEERKEELASTPSEDPWGVTLSVLNITPTGLTVILTQSGGEPTGDLQFGSDYTLKVRKNGVWEYVPYIIEEGSVAWHSVAYILPMDGNAEQEISWAYLYGSLPDGTYLLSKSVQDFRSTGDFDSAVYSVEFEIR